MANNDFADAEHERNRRRLGITWDAYWAKLARERVGDENEQVAHVLKSLRQGSYDDRIRAETIERLIGR